MCGWRRGDGRTGCARAWPAWWGLLALALLAALAGACGGGNDHEEFELTASDGFVFAAEVTRADGDSDAWVLLGHQFTGERRDWDVLRDELVDDGFNVLTWDFRCHGESPCETETRGESVEHIWREWNAAIDYAVQQEPRTLYGIGASMGGTSLMQVAADRGELDAVAAVSSPNRFRGLDALEHFDQVTAPKLFVVGNFDQAAPDFSRRYQAEAVGPSRLVVLETDLHGNTLVKDDGEFGSEARRLLVEFVADPASAVAEPSIDPGPAPEEEEEQAEEPAAADASPASAAEDGATAAPATDSDGLDDEEPAEDATPGEPEAVTLHTDDGLDLAATLRPGSGVWILLGHQLRASRADWGALDEQLQADGFSVLAWDFRDHGESPVGDEGAIDLDWLAAIDYAEEHGADEIWGVGASMGGTSALVVAARDPRLDGVVTISAPALFLGLDGGAAVAAMQAPLLVIAGLGDAEAIVGADLFRRTAAEHGLDYNVVVVDTAVHGNGFFGDADLGRAVYDHIRDFLPAPDGAKG